VIITALALSVGVLASLSVVLVVAIRKMKAEMKSGTTPHVWEFPLVKLGYRGTNIDWYAIGPKRVCYICGRVELREDGESGKYIPVTIGDPSKHVK
jgi:hypothetical protein